MLSMGHAGKIQPSYENKLPAGQAEQTGIRVQMSGKESEFRCRASGIRVQASPVEFAPLVSFEEFNGASRF
jgi:hypothetical protein